MIHIITDLSATVILGGVVYLVAHDQPTYRPIVEAVRAGDEQRVKNLITSHRRVMHLVDYFGDAKVVDGVVLERGPPNKLLHDVLDNLDGDFITPLETAERVLRF